MKHKYLFLLALAGAMTVSTSVMAQSQWNEPVAPTAPAISAQYAGNFVDPEAGGQYYLYNVGSGLFLGGGQTWGTRGIVLCDSVVSVSQEPVKINNVNNNTSVNYVLPFEVQTNALDETAWTIVALNNSKNTAGDMYFVGEDGAQTWIDGGESRWSDYGAWMFIPAESGYLIQNVYAGAKYADKGEVAFGVDGYNTSAGWATTWTDLAVTPDEENTTLPWIIWRFVSADDYEAVADYCKAYYETVNGSEFQSLLKAYEEAKKVYDARIKLYELYQSIISDGLDVNTEDAYAVYAFDDATAEELEAAYGALQAEINRAGWAAEWASASEDNPLEVTEYCLTNPAFDDGNINGWVCTFVSGTTATNIGYQGASYTNTEGEVDDFGNPVSIGKFIEAWSSSSTNGGVVGDGLLYQTVYGMPAGKYVLEADIIAVDQYAGHNPVDGVYLYINADGRETRTAVASNNGQPKHFSVTFINNNSIELTFGLKTEGATANWIAADNFKITFYGKTTESAAQAILKAALQSAKAINLEDIKAYAGAKSYLAVAIADAEVGLAAGADDEVCETLTANLKAAQADLNESIAAYKTLYNYINPNTGQLTIYVEQVGTNDHWDELATVLENLLNDLTEAYEEGTISTEEINEKIASVPTIIRDFLSGDNIKEGDDVTLLMVNPGFDTNLDGWEIKSGARPTISNGLAEVYCAAFDIHQVIKDMPAGVYNITLQGFTRNQPGGNRKAFTEAEQAGTTFAIYTQSSEAKIQNILAGGSPVLLNQRGDETEPEDYIGVDNGIAYDIAAELEDGTVIYMPNGMPSARTHFDNGGYMTTIKVVNAQRGDLDLGIRCTSTQEWCLWDNLTITYAGQNISDYLTMLDARVEELNDLILKATNYTVEESAPELDLLTQEALVQSVVLTEKIAKKDDIEDPDEVLALIDEIAELEEYIQEGIEAGSKVYELASLIQDYAMNMYSSSDENLPALVADIMDKIQNSSDNIASNATYLELGEQLNYAWPQYIFADVEEEPAEKADVTGAIINNDYTLWGVGNSTQGWQNPGVANYAEMEVYNTDTINVYQDLIGLKPGFYELQVQGFYRAGFPGNYTDSLAQVKNAYMFAKTSIGEITERMQNALDTTSVESIADGESIITPSLVTTLWTDVFIPNNMACAENYFNMADKYHNSLLAQVGEDGTMTIGIRKDTHIEGDWTIFTNWQLFYLGKTGKNFAEELSSVNSVNNTAVKMTQIFGIDGTRNSSLRRGINIVRMNDGSIRKILVK